MSKVSKEKIKINFNLAFSNDFYLKYKIQIAKNDCFSDRFLCRNMNIWHGDLLGCQMCDKL